MSSGLHRSRAIRARTRMLGITYARCTRLLTAQRSARPSACDVPDSGTRRCEVILLPWRASNGRCALGQATATIQGSAADSTLNHGPLPYQGKMAVERAAVLFMLSARSCLSTSAVVAPVFPGVVTQIVTHAGRDGLHAPRGRQRHTLWSLVRLRLVWQPPSAGVHGWRQHSYSLGYSVACGRCRWSSPGGALWSTCGNAGRPRGFRPVCAPVA
jgi:hypothetical protein